MFGTVEKFFAGAFGLIALYLIVFYADGANKVLRGLGQFNALTFGTLQGKTVNSLGV